MAGQTDEFTHTHTHTQTVKAREKREQKRMKAMPDEQSFAVNPLKVYAEVTCSFLGTASQVV